MLFFDLLVRQPLGQTLFTIWIGARFDSVLQGYE
jgi:hypothetical protein